MAITTRGADSLRKALEPVKPRMSRKDLADALDVTTSAVWAWIVGRSKPEPDKMAQIEDMLGIPMRDWVEPVDADEPTDTTAA